MKKDIGSSKTSTEVKRPTGVKIKSEVEPPKPKVHRLFILNFFSTFAFKI
jgi:hypothetical protein